jgi:hypothetical protein
MIEEVNEIEELLGVVQMGTFFEVNIGESSTTRVRRLTIMNIEPVLVNYGKMAWVNFI